MTALAAPTTAASVDPAVVTLAARHGATLSEVLSRRAALQPNAEFIRFLAYDVDSAGVAHALTFAEADRRVTALAAAIARVAAPGDRVAVLTAQGLEFVIGFLAALRAGTVAVPLFSPDLPGHDDRLRAVLADCDASLVLATTANRDLVADFVAPTAVLVVDDLESTEAIGDDASSGWTPPVVDPADTAYLQYTSGSTRLPAGVRISHAAVVHNAADALVAGDADEGSTLVSWLPLFHDMGLVFVVGGSLVGGMTSVLMDPIAFLMRPQRWLEQLAANPRPFTAAPNFAYDFCSKRIPEAERAALDLSGVRIMFNGAEPIAQRTLDTFYDAFAAAGLRRGVISPAYGLAEATVYVTSARVDGAPQSIEADADALGLGRIEAPRPGTAAVRLVLCGTTCGARLAIADRATGRRVPDAVVAEIWVHGASNGDGYWGRPDQTAEVFGLRLGDAGDLPAEGWLRTGDLGAIVDGQLVVTGRIKDVLIIDGRNHYPQDIERTVEEAHEVLGRHRSAAFSIEADGAEQAVVVAEVSRHHVDGDWDPAEVVRAVSRAVSRAHGVKVSDVVLIAPDTIPRTTSGKIARAACRTAHQAGTLSRRDARA